MAQREAAVDLLPLAVAGPGLAAWAVSTRRARYRAAVERALPAVAAAIADSLTAGRTLRASFPAAAPLTGTVIPSGGHYVPEESPEALLAIIEPFLAGG